MLKFNKKYFAFFLLIFITEVLIALYIDDAFVRPYFGDVLVVMLIYCFVKSFLKINPIVAATGVLVFAFFIEFCQYLNMVEVLGLEKSKLARTVLGTSFSWADMICYGIGFLVILGIERLSFKRKIS